MLLNRFPKTIWSTSFIAVLAVFGVSLISLFYAAQRLYGTPAALLSLLRGDDIVLNVLAEVPETIESGEILRIPVRINNVSGNDITLQDVTPLESRYFDGLSKVLSAWTHHSCDLVIYTVGMNGPYTIDASIRTNSTLTPYLALEVPLQVLSDEVVRDYYLGHVRSGTVITRTIDLENLPADNFTHFGDPRPPGWTILRSPMQGRTMGVTIQGTVPYLVDGREDQWALEFDVFFSSADVRRARIKVTGVTVPEWSYPRRVVVNPATSSEGFFTLNIIHRSSNKDQSAPTGEVTVTSGMKRSFLIWKITQEIGNQNGWNITIHSVVLQIKKWAYGTTRDLEIHLTNDMGTVTDARIRVEIIDSTE